MVPVVPARCERTDGRRVFFSFFLSFWRQPTSPPPLSSPLLSFLPCGLFVAAQVHGTALIHIEGAFEESSSVQLFHPLRSPVLIYIQVSASVAPSLPLPYPDLPPPPSASVCSRLKKCFCIPLFIFTSITPAYSDVPPPPPPRFLAQLFFLTNPSSAFSFAVFCFAD